MEAREREIEYYETSTDCPFVKWRKSILDKKHRAAIDARITRLRAGNPGVSRTAGAGVLESVIDFGPGYRIYYGIDGNKILLLYGGDKSKQSRDIEIARSMWAEYRGRK